MMAQDKRTRDRNYQETITKAAKLTEEERMELAKKALLAAVVRNAPTKN